MSKTKARSKVKTMPWDSATYLKTGKDIAHYLEAVFEDGDPSLVAAALGDVARAKGMAQIAIETGLSREQLYRSFSENGNPTLKSTLAVMKALGIDLSAKVHEVV